MQGNAQPLAYSIEQVCDLTGLSRSLVYDLMAEGKLGYVKAGRRRIIPATAVTQFLESASGAAA